ncbi:hypothetical protein [Roseicella sp. DB1501]|uniref:hypothetical protein n=1 Tax=Roseicella sp. DB1501 TaxID=2730925 RepID=UPI0014915CCF|nr:hypothetical protein [Roseicella sp. DB1501]NOG74197.1 hypothetical protein [Roseicella sp. DB1501]
MSKITREFYKTVKGPMANDEDWWRLVYDTEKRRLYVEHEWSHVPLRGAGNSGTDEYDINAFLAAGGQAASNLDELLRSLQADS